MCFGSVEDGRRCLSNDFPRRFLLRSHVYSRSPSGKHMGLVFHAWWRHVCMRGLGVTRAVRRTHTQAQNTQRPGEPRDLSPLYQFTQPPRRPRCSWREACGQHFTHACVHTCPRHMNQPSNLSYFMLLITSLLL